MMPQSSPLQAPEAPPLADAEIPAVAVAGCGDWGKNLVRVFAELGALTTVCDSNDDRASDQAKAHGVDPTDWSTVLADLAVSAVAVAAPAAAHYALVREALLSDKFERRFAPARDIDSPRLQTLGNS